MSSPRPAPRPALRPGALVLRRDRHHLQIGTSPGIVVADRPGLMGFLLSLDGTAETADVARLHPMLDDPHGTVRELAALGAVVDARRWSPVAWRECRAQHPAPTPVTERAQYRVDVHADAGTTHFAEVVCDLLRACGVVHLDTSEPDLLVVVASAEPPRTVFTDAAAQGLDHLVVRCDERRVLIGPCVSPGASPCIGCHDLHRADGDRAWSALLPQFGARSPHHNPPAVPALTLQAAAVEVAAAILGHLDGRSSALGAVVAVGPEHDARAVRPVTFHPRCPCTLLFMGAASGS